MTSLRPTPASAAEAFCTAGSGAGQCDDPHGVAVEEETGNVYVVDRGNHRINVFSSAGAFLSSFGAAQLVNPTNVAVDNDAASSSYRDVYVVDGFRVVKFSRTGSKLLEFGSQGLGNGQFSRSGNSIGAGPGGTIFVCDSEALGNEKFAVSVEAFTPAGAFVKSVPLAATEKSCRGFAVDSNEDFYITPNDFTAGVQKYDSSGAALYTLGTEASTGGAIAVDGADHLYVVQTVQGPTVIAEYDATGEILSRFGYGDIQFNLNGLAVHSSTGDLYGSEPDVGSTLGNQVVLIASPPPGPIVWPASVIANPVGNVRATLKAEINAEGEETEYRVEYVEGAVCEEDEDGGGECFENAVSSDLSLLAGEDFLLHTASALFGCPNPLSEFEEGKCLTPETRYRMRVIAENDNGEGNSPVEGQPFETLPWLELGGSWATSVGSDSAQLHAEVNPLGIPVSGRFQYVDEEHFQSEGGFASAHTQTTGEVDFGAGTALQARSATLRGLAPGTTYRYRVVVANPLMTGPVSGAAHAMTTRGNQVPLPADPCGNAQFRTGASAHLPSCRAFEMVSPVDKEGGDIIGAINSNAERAEFNQVATAGGKLTYSSYRAFGDAKSAPYTSQYVATRYPLGSGPGTEGWRSQAISPPRGINILGLAKTLDSEFRAFSSDLCHGWLLHDTDPPLAPAAPAGFANFYKSDLCGGGGYEAVTSVEPPDRDPEHFFLELQGVSGDGTAAIYRATDALTANAPKVTTAFLVYGFRAGLKPRLICILPGGASVGTGGCAAGTAQGSTNGRTGTVSNAISDDGSRVFWSASNSGPGSIYLRENPFGAGAECVKATAPCSVPVSGTVTGLQSQFWAAAADGSKAIFTVVGGGPLNGNLYEFDTEAKASILIAPDVNGVLGASDDASRIYFASEAVLTPEPNSEGRTALADEPNVYLYEAAAGGGSGEVSFVATISDADAKSVTLFEPSPVNVEAYKHLARVTPDGRRLVFMSSGSPTGYDNTDASSGKPDHEVYTYEAGGPLFCISCNPTGARPVGRELIDGTQLTGVWAAAQIPAPENQLYAPRVITDDGSRVFFETADALLPQDTNGQQDVYEWERAENGTACEASGTARFIGSAGGCLGLISTGESRSDSWFVDASGDGTDVFIGTGESLVSHDPGQIDIYDARAGGGFPPPPAPKLPCVGEACQSPPPPPAEVTPTSSAFRGVGNSRRRGSKSRRCPKGKSRVKGKGKSRCVKKKGSKQRQAPRRREGAR